MFAGFYYMNMKEYIYTNHRKRIRRYSFTSSLLELYTTL